MKSLRRTIAAVLAVLLVMLLPLNIVTANTTDAEVEISSDTTLSDGKTPEISAASEGIRITPIKLWIIILTVSISMFALLVLVQRSRFKKMDV